jgi:hypothetical protein
MSNNNNTGVGWEGGRGRTAERQTPFFFEPAPFLPNQTVRGPSGATKGLGTGGAIEIASARGGRARWRAKRREPRISFSFGGEEEERKEREG